MTPADRLHAAHRIGASLFGLGPAPTLDRPEYGGHLALGRFEARTNATLTCKEIRDAARNLAIRGKQRFTLSSSLASMAFALPGAMGAQLAFPDRQVIALAGDGGFSMLMSDFLTAVDLDLPITVVVFNNHKLGLIQVEQESQGFPEFQTALRNPDYAEFGRLCGGEGGVVRDPDGLEPALRRAFASDRPWIVDVHVNPTEIVMPPKVMTRFMLGYAVAKAKEMLGRGDREAGVEPLGDLTPLVEDRLDDQPGRRRPE